MNPFDRAIIIIFALAGIAAALLYSLFITGWAMPGIYYAQIAGISGYKEIACTAMAFIILAGIRMVWAGLHTRKKHAVVQEGPLGQIRIALGAIESLVEKVSSDQRGVREAKAVVESTSGGIGIRVRTVVAPDVAIPDLSRDLQGIIHDRVLQVTGIEVQDIRILVSNISTQKLRVE